MSQEDVLDRLRSLDPNVGFHDDDEPYEAQAVMHRVLARPHARRRRLRLPSVPRVAAVARWRVETSANATSCSSG